MESFYEDSDKLSEECGVFGIYDYGVMPKEGDPQGTPCQDLDCARLTYYGLFALQHRGQESCGIAVSDNGDVSFHKDMGLVSEVFNDDTIEKLHGQISIGHVRYSTTGSSVRENAQPLVIKYIKGSLSIVHNGNLTNTTKLRNELESKGAIFQTTIDSEIIAYLIAKERITSPNVETAVMKTMKYLEGSYSILVMSPKKIIAVRDPLGYRPLCYGKMSGGAIVFSSESCALDAIGAEFIRDVEPGEIVIVDKYGLRSIKDYCTPGICRKCIFEYIYFARPDSVIDGISVYEARLEAGRLLSRQHPVDADLVTGVPDTGIAAALGYSQESGIPYAKGFVKNNYVGRTFIQPKQSQRDIGVGIKLNVLASSVKGKRVIMIDDSIVRGTTVARIVKMLKKAGALEVHVRISSPPFRWPCYFGTDIPSSDQLTASKHTIEEICEIIGADSLGFLQISSLHRMIGFSEDEDLCDGKCATGCKGMTAVCAGAKQFCDACFTGEYPTPIDYDSIITEKC
ncbi:MAG: amidophosphoribosyltransferase [Saccharofermentanales bacterium]